MWPTEDSHLLLAEHALPDAGEGETHLCRVRPFLVFYDTALYLRKDYGPREPVSAVFSLCLFFVCLGGHGKHANPLGTVGGPAMATVPRPSARSRSGCSARASLWSVSPQASAVLIDAGGPRVGSHSLADAPRRQISLYPSGDDKAVQRRSALQRARFQWSIGRLRLYIARAVLQICTPG